MMKYTLSLMGFILCARAGASDNPIWATDGSEFLAENLPDTTLQALQVYELGLAQSVQIRDDGYVTFTYGDEWLDWIERVVGENAASSIHMYFRESGVGEWTDMQAWPQMFCDRIRERLESSPESAREQWPGSNYCVNISRQLQHVLVFNDDNGQPMGRSEIWVHPHADEAEAQRIQDLHLQCIRPTTQGQRTWNMLEPDGVTATITTTDIATGGYQSVVQKYPDRESAAAALFRRLPGGETVQMGDRVKTNDDRTATVCGVSHGNSKWYLHYDNDGPKSGLFTATEWEWVEKENVTFLERPDRRDVLIFKTKTVVTSAVLRGDVSSAIYFRQFS